VAPNNIAPATALAPTALAARRRTEVSEIDILVAPWSSGGSDTKNVKSPSLANAELPH
jgi:hypothetical protein